MIEGAIVEDFPAVVDPVVVAVLVVEGTPVVGGSGTTAEVDGVFYKGGAAPDVGRAWFEKASAKDEGVAALVASPEVASFDTGILDGQLGTRKAADKAGATVTPEDTLAEGKTAADHPTVEGSAVVDEGAVEKVETGEGKTGE